jgi:CHAT domain-containing protein
MDGNPEIAGFAFENAERMKASSVFDRLSDQLAKESSLIPDSLTHLERTLNYSITSYTEKLYNLKRSENTDSHEINATDSILFQLKRQRDELSQYLERNYSDYYELKYAVNSIRYSEVQQNIKSNEVLIEYVLNETEPAPELYAFCFSSGRKGFHKIDIDSAFIRSIETSFRFMSNPAYLFTRKDNSRAFCAASHNLYQKLIQPFESEIQDKKLTIIPDGKLSYIPFDALLTEMPDTTGQIQFNQLPYLIRNTTINYAYSANLLFKFNRQKRKAKNRIIAFAPEYQSDTIEFENEKLILVPLPGVQKEVDIISKEINTRLFRGNEATEQNFREHSQNHDILHLAMHAFINDSLPAFSRFAFVQNPTGTADNDGWLNTADIYNLDLNARLTVLSACNTGSGRLRKGEGVLSLARGFLFAGCPTIVMTLWEVEDNAGTKIMSSFYQNLKKGRTTDESLRLAKLKYLEEANPRMAHPHYWLGYVSIGSAQTLFRSYDYYFMGLVILALLVITADQFIRMKRARKKRYKK